MLQGPGTKESTAGVTRRQFGAMGAGAALVSYSGGASAATLEVTEHVVAAGQANGRLYQPTQGKHPGLIMWAPDSNAARHTARSLSKQGWSVLVLNESPSADDVGTPAFTSRTRKLVGWLQQQDSVAKSAGKVGPGSIDLGHGYVLRNVAAALPRFSLASVGERREASHTAYLFAVSAAVLAKSPQRLDSLNDAARTAMRLSGVAKAAA